VAGDRPDRVSLWPMVSAATNNTGMMKTAMSVAADTAPALLAFEARVVAVGQRGRRVIPLDDFFVRSGVTTLAPGDLVEAIEMPVRSGRRGSVHARRTRRRGHDLASVTLAVAAAITTIGVLLKLCLVTMPWMVRAMMSAPPPVPAGTINSIGRVGSQAAFAVVRLGPRTSAAAPKRPREYLESCMAIFSRLCVCRSSPAWRCSLLGRGAASPASL